MHIWKFITVLGLTGTTLAVPNAIPEPQSAKKCSVYLTLTSTITIAPTITIPVAITAIDRTVNCGACVLILRTKTIRTTIQRVPAGRAIRTVLRRSTATIRQPVCRTQA
ncbi:hypothetical protein TWF481_009720 [Arthrobotrys musiformis]|uniref:Uncharacterized protein n=1 Tax=Arthrobotrys musiformis TaxID=47236 RepID=A0AAV9WAF6_9PEZI